MADTRPASVAFPRNTCVDSRSLSLTLMQTLGNVPDNPLLRVPPRTSVGERNLVFLVHRVAANHYTFQAVSGAVDAATRAGSVVIVEEPTIESCSIYSHQWVGWCLEPVAMCLSAARCGCRYRARSRPRGGRGREAPSSLSGADPCRGPHGQRCTPWQLARTAHTGKVRIQGQGTGRG